MPFRVGLPALVLLMTSATAVAQITPTFTTGGRQVTVLWSSALPGTTELAWGQSPSTLFSGYANRLAAPGSSTMHSATLRRLSPGTWYVRARTGALDSAEHTVVVPDDGAPLADWAFDGVVKALLRQGSRWYVGGDFQWVGQTTGGGVPTLFDGGLPPQFPEVAGQVLAVEADGMGGFYVGGSFTSVGGLPRSNVAHLLADLGVDPEWKPACNGPVYAIQPGPGSVYLAGSFTVVSGQNRGPLVEVTPDGGPTSWNPSVNGLVFALEQVGSNLYLGGNFSEVNGQSRRGLAAVDTSGTLQGWNPSLTGGSVAGLLALGGAIYVHGAFTDIGSQSRAGLAALDLAGNVLPWNPPVAGGQVSAFAPNSLSSLFLGGSFTSVGTLNRPALALVDTDAGQPLLWNTGVASGQVFGLATEGGGVSAVGRFTRTAAGLSEATFSTTNGEPLSVGPRFNGVARVVARSPSLVFVGGDFTGLREQPRTGLAAISSAGALEPFSPTLTGGTFGTRVNALASQGSNLLVGGNFSQVDGTSRNNAAMFSGTGALSLGWNPNVSGEVQALAVTPAGVLVGGLFDQVNGSAFRGNGAIVDVVNGQAIAFNPGFDSSVFGIASEGATSYWVGGFGATNGMPRGHAAEFTLPTGTLGVWNPAIATEVRAVHVVGDRVVFGGAFEFVNVSIVRRAIAVFQRDGGGVTPFDAQLSGVVGVQALTSAGTTLYAGGDNLTDAGLVISVDLGSSVVRGIDVRGQIGPYLTTKVGHVETLAIDCAAQRVAVGGFFHSAGLTPVGGLTLIQAPCDAGVVDAGVVDAGVVDAGVVDAGAVDAGSVDAGAVDAGAVDAGAVDAGSVDAGSVDAGSVDAGSVDAGSVDAGSVDAGVISDAGSVDTDAGMGTVDAGVMSDAGSAVDAGVAQDGGPPRDGGAAVDAGSIDGGGPVLDAGDSDAGSDGGRVVFVPVCGCSGVDQAPLGLGLLLVLIHRRRWTR